MTVTVIGVDPGKTVGIACYVDGKFWSTQLPRADALPYLAGVLEGLDDGLSGPYVAVERFYRGMGGPVRTYEEDAPAVIALVSELCVARALRFDLQSPSDAKSCCTDEWLRAVEWWQPLGLEHANDAARHVKLALMHRFKNEFTRVYRGDTIKLNRIEEEEEAGANRGTEE